MEKQDGGFEARMVEKMQITWEEIFEKSFLKNYFFCFACFLYVEACIFV